MVWYGNHHADIKNKNPASAPIGTRREVVRAVACLQQKHDCREMHRLVADSLDAERVAPASGSTHLASELIVKVLLPGPAAQWIELRRVDLRAQPADGRHIARLETMRLQIAALVVRMGRSLTAAGAGRRRARNQRRARGSSKKHKQQCEARAARRRGEHDGMRWDAMGILYCFECQGKTTTASDRRGQHLVPCALT